MIKATINGKIITVKEGDITKEDVDAIVNAANTSLLGGGGVDGAIHRASGRELVEECHMLHGCKTGDAKITKGYKLIAKHVIHTVGPVYGHNPQHAELLASAYKRSLEVADENDLKRISFPAISTGIYGYPKEEAAHISLNTIIDYLRGETHIEEVNLVMFGSSALSIVSQVLQQYIDKTDDLVLI